MRTRFVLLASLFALLIAAAPVAAHHGRGSHAGGRDADDGPKGAKSEQRGGFSACDWQSDPASCPGNSGWAHWCEQQHGSGPERGQCVAEHAHTQGTDLDRDDNDNDNGQHGDLRIADVDVDDGGSFRIRGSGAEGVVTVSVGGVSGQVVGSGQGVADQNGSFDIVGVWSCRDDDREHAARVRALDADESDSERVIFPCDE